MELSLIKSDEQYQQYLDWVNRKLDLKIAKESSEGRKLVVAGILIKDYEDQNFLIPFLR